MPTKAFWIPPVVSNRPLSLVLAVSHGAVEPRDRADLLRAKQRGGLELPTGRPVLDKTQKGRDRLLEAFDEWLKGQGLSLTFFLEPSGADVETVNLFLGRYGRELFAAGRPYGHYVETVNGVAAKRPAIRRMLQGAWDIAYAWIREEPPIHHLAMPWQVLLSLLAVAMAWGWIAEAGVISLSFGAVTRIGEVLSAVRSDLLMPRDFGYTHDYVMLQIREPKTRFRAARHQVARLDQPQLMKVVEMAFFALEAHQSLWNMSPQTMRLRFKKLLKAVRLDALPRQISKSLDLGSLRAGGATWLFMTSEDSKMTRRRGRWVNSKIMEVYVQEVASVQFLHLLSIEAKQIVLQGVLVFVELLDLFWDFWMHGIPVGAWRSLVGALAARKQKKLGEESEG